jgi:membrane complex biogenesis BtpA family protein
VVIGTVHLLPLPGSPQYEGQSMAEIEHRALSDAEAYASGGVDGLIIENSGDLPFLKPNEIGHETTAFMTRLTHAVARKFPLPVGVNCLANAVIPSIAVAAASGAAFVRSNQWVNAYVANEGYVEGASARATRFRSLLRANSLRFFADVHVKHGSHAIVADRTVEEQGRDAEFFDADVLIATGSRTGQATSPSEVREVGRLSALPVLVGSGLSPANVVELSKVARGAIVGSSLKHDGVWWNPVDLDRVKEIMSIVTDVHGGRDRWLPEVKRSERSVP